MHNAKPSKEISGVALENLLGREQACLNDEHIRESIQGKVVLVTGAAGSIGSELCRQIARFGPLALVGFDQAETPLFQLVAELQGLFPSIDFRSEIGDINRVDNLSRTMLEYQPSIVFHAAAYKHVPMLERHIFAAVENNIFGTCQVADAAADHGVEFFVMVSTDKVVRPTSVMGATKRVAELTIRAKQKKQGTKFIAVRFGNVLGSSGSVVPIFKSQIAAGGPVTVTHPEMKRYFMTMSEAGQLVLQALVLGSGGEIFVLDMGEPIKIVDLARNLIQLSGFEPGKDIEIEFIGARPGEKLFEELSLPNERAVPTSHPRISSLIPSEEVDATRVEASLQELREAVSTCNSLRTIRLLKEMVPDYIPASRLFGDGMSIKSDNGIEDDVEYSWAQNREQAAVNNALQTNEPVVCAAHIKV